MGAVLVGSACPAAWLIVTVGGVGSNVTVLSVLVEAVFPLPAASVAPPAGVVPSPVQPVCSLLPATVKGLGPPVTSTVLVPPAVPPITTSLPVKPLTGSLKTAVKVMGAVLVGSAWPAAWLIVSLGGVGSDVSLLSVLVEAVFPLPAASVPPPAGIVSITLPPVVRPLTAPVPYPTLSRSSTVLVPPAVPPITTSLPVKPLTGSLKTAVKVMGAVLVGSACPAAWLIVSVGGGATVTVWWPLVEAGFRLPAASVAPPAETVAHTIPPVVRPPAATVDETLPLHAALPMLPPAVPPITTSLPVKPLTDSLKTAVKVMGAVLVGSACPAAWLIVTVGGGAHVSVLSMLVEAVFALPAASEAPPAGIVATTVPAAGWPLSATVYRHGAP